MSTPAQIDPRERRRATYNLFRPPTSPDIHLRASARVTATINALAGVLHGRGHRLTMNPAGQISYIDGTPTHLSIRPASSDYVLPTDRVYIQFGDPTVADVFWGTEPAEGWDIQGVATKIEAYINAVCIAQNKETA